MQGGFLVVFFLSQKGLPASNWRRGSDNEERNGKIAPLSAVQPPPVQLSITTGVSWTTFAYDIKGFNK